MKVAFTPPDHLNEDFDRVKTVPEGRDPSLKDRVLYLYRSPKRRASVDL